MHILLVDDDSFLLRKLALNLKALGHDVQQAESVAQAKARLKDNARAFDLILTDVRMPDESGLDLVQHLQNSEHDGAIAIMSAYADIEMTIAALRLHAVDFIIKPVTDIALHDLLARTHRIKGKQEHKQTLELPVLEEFHRVVLPADRCWTGDLARRLTRHFAALLLPADLDNFCLAISEALQNAVVHGNLEISSDLRQNDDWKGYDEAINQRLKQAPFCDRKVTVESRYDGHCIRITVQDEGPGFDRSSLSSPLDPDALLNANGRGITLMWFAMDDVQWNDAGNRVEMTKIVRS